MKKIILILMTYSCFITFLLLNSSDSFAIKGYPISKIINVVENYKKSENPYKLHDALKKIETKHNIKIIKFTSFKNDKTIQYNFNSISPISWNKKSFFNKNIKVTNMTQKIEDKDIIGIYYFTDYNSSIDKELSYLGLATVNYEIRPTS